MPSITNTAGVDKWVFTTSPLTGDTKSMEGTHVSASLVVEGIGGVSADGVIEVSNTPDVAGSWVTLVTLSANGTTSAMDTAVAQAAWAYNRARVTGLTGTGAVAEFTCSSR